MKSRLSAHLILCLAVLYLAGAFAGSREAMAAAGTGLSDLDRQVPFALAIRGGVSLGSYESGFNWVLLQYMKRHWAENRGRNGNYIELKATSGASAGSINALISTISWCVDDSKTRAGELFPDSVSDNLLRDTWLDIGFEELLPQKVESLQYYRADDGVFTRNAFLKTITRIERLLDSNVFRPGCEVPFGILVTRVEPIEKDIAGIQVHSQRSVIPLRLRADRSGHARFVTCLVDSEAPEFGNVMYLQGTRTADPECPVAHDTNDIIDAIEASSAFPIAFGRKHLRYCEPAAEVADSADTGGGSCPEGMRPVVKEFIDGGLFDNIPLGTAMALAEPREQDRMPGSVWEKTGRRFNYIYLDPTIRRSVRQEAGQERKGSKTGKDAAVPELDKVTYGIRSQLKFLGGAIRSGRDYELYNQLNGGDWTNQVFAHAEKLAHAINVRFPGLVLEKPQPGKRTLMVQECKQLFERKWGKTNPPDLDIIVTANHCIDAGTYLLELQYRGVPFDHQLKTSGEITRQRNILIDRVVKLAGYVGEDRLALAAERARDDKLGDRRILLSSRLSPVIGEMMEAFGAFVDRSFREYDYYAGIYDAVWGIANFVCERHFNQAACMPAQIHEIYLALRIQESPRANTVFLYLLRREFADESGWDDGFAWVATYTSLAADRNMLAIAKSLFVEHAGSGETSYQAPSMTAFITSLINEQYDASESSAFLQRIFKLRDEDELTWYYPLTLRASNRLLFLERQESEVKEDGYMYTTGLALGAFFLHSYMQEEEVTFNVSTAPDFSWQAWLPDEVAVDARNGGLDLSWYQGLKVGNKGWRWDVKLTPVQVNDSVRSGGERLWFSQVDFLVSYKTHGIFSAVGAGPSASWTWKQWPDSEQLNYGAAMYLGFVEDKIRLTVGTLSFADEFAGDNYYINIGINDVPGLVYWGLSGWRGSWWPSKAKW